MKNTTNFITPEKTVSQLFNSWKAVIHFLNQFSWSPSKANSLHIRELKSGEWQVRIEGGNQINKPLKKARSYGIGLHDLSW